MRGGQIVSGQDACVTLIRKQEAQVVLLDENASANTTKRITDACRTHQVPLYVLVSDSLGRSIGKAGRMVIALPKGNMADKVLQLASEPTQMREASTLCQK